MNLENNNDTNQQEILVCKNVGVEFPKRISAPSLVDWASTKFSWKKDNSKFLAWPFIAFAVFDFICQVWNYGHLTLIVENLMNPLLFVIISCMPLDLSMKFQNTKKLKVQFFLHRSDF